MNIRSFVPVVLGIAMLSAPVLAAGTQTTTGAQHPATQKMAAMSPTERCTNLGKQFDAAIKTHGSAKKAADAKTLRADGGKLCTGGKSDEGIAKLEQALKDIGVKAKS